MDDETLVTTRLALHALAVQVISQVCVQATGNEIALRVRPEGFGTPELPGGGWAGVSGTDVVVVEPGGEERRAAIRSLRGAAEWVGLTGAAALPSEPLEVHAGAARLIAATLANGDEALRTLIDGARPADDVSAIHLWPEHFDIAVEFGAAAVRGTYGVSPGDADHTEPYAYVSAWSPPPEGLFWNATGFTGAERSADDPDEIVAFWREAHRLLTA